MKKAKSIRVVCVSPPQAKTIHIHVTGDAGAVGLSLAREMADFDAMRDSVRAEMNRGARRTSGRTL